jgi:hypothetical protein
MPINNQVVQIWIDLPNGEYQETLQATPLFKSLFQIREIPFMSERINLMDIVRCYESCETPPTFTEVVKSSGNSTVHIYFAENTPKEMVSLHIRTLLQKGATYRRSGLRAFSINIPPEADKSSIVNYIAQLDKSGLLSHESRDGIGAVEQSRRHLDYLLGKRPILQDGTVPETELDLRRTDQSTSV